MNDKEIYIDGIDVSGCSFYEDNHKYRMWGTCDCMRSMVDQSGYDELAGAECKGYNCYYKQLKRKEQECERLTSTLTEIKEIATHCIKQDICTTCDNSDKCHIEDEEIPTYDVCKLILQKISEVIDE